jgi:hypothetical protein
MNLDFVSIENRERLSYFPNPVIRVLFPLHISCLTEIASRSYVALIVFHLGVASRN